MNTIKVAVSDLLKHLKKNRDAHVKEYAEAMVGYREALVKELKAMTKKAIAGEDIELYVRVVQPENYEQHYTEAIEILEWTVDKEVEIDRHQFKQYVQDEWQWKQQFARTAGLYKA
jgi:hypothetical protein